MQEKVNLVEHVLNVVVVVGETMWIIVGSVTSMKCMKLDKLFILGVNRKCRCSF